MLGIMAEHGTVVSDRRLKSAQLLLDKASAVVGVGILGGVGQDPLETGQCLLERALPMQQAAEFVARFGVARLERQRASEASLGPVRVPVFNLE